MNPPPLIIYPLWLDGEFNSMLVSLGPKYMNRKVQNLLWLFSLIVAEDNKVHHKPFSNCIALTNKWIRQAIGQSQADEFAKGKNSLKR